MAADGSGQTELVGNRREMWDVAWSPDSTQIAFIDDPGGAFEEELFVMNPDGSGVRRLNVDTETSFDWARRPPGPCDRTGVIRGTDKNDVLKDTSGNDVICGGLGNDTIRASAGNDVVYGEDGNDSCGRIQQP